MNQPARPKLTKPTKVELALSEVEEAPPPLREEPPVLTVIIPVYNEVRTIDELLRRVVAAPCDKQVIVIDDGSTDGTEEVLEKWEGHPQVTLLQHSKNRGKGAAIRTGLEHADGRFTVIQDGDLEYDPQDYPRLIEPLISAEAEVVYGSRRLGRVRCWHDWINPFFHGVSLLNAWVRLLYGAALTDEATCYKAFPTQMLRAMNLQCERFEFCPEVTAKACRLGLHILEVPIHYQARTRRAGKKIRFRDGVEAFSTLWRWRNWRPRESEAGERQSSSGFLGKSGSGPARALLNPAQPKGGKCHVEAGE